LAGVRREYWLDVDYRGPIPRFEIAHTQATTVDVREESTLPIGFTSKLITSMPGDAFCVPN
jgi:hypothetical protein